MIGLGALLLGDDPAGNAPSQNKATNVQIHPRCLNQLPWHHREGLDEDDYAYDHQVRVRREPALRVRTAPEQTVQVRKPQANQRPSSQADQKIENVNEEHHAAAPSCLSWDRARATRSKKSSIKTDSAFKTHPINK